MIWECSLCQHYGAFTLARRSRSLWLAGTRIASRFERRMHALIFRYSYAIHFNSLISALLLTIRSRSSPSHSSPSHRAASRAQLFLSAFLTRRHVRFCTKHQYWFRLPLCIRCAYSAAYVLLCISRRSRSRVLLTRNALWPDGIMWRVFLLLP